MAAHPHFASGDSSSSAGSGAFQRSVRALFEYSRRALVLVWTTNRPLSIALAALTVLAGVLPAGVAYIGALIVDAVIRAAELHHRTGVTALAPGCAPVLALLAQPASAKASRIRETIGRDMTRV